MSLFKLPNNTNERPRRLLIQPSATSPFCTTPSQLQEVTLDPDATNFSYVGMRSPGAPQFNNGRSVKEIDEQLTNLRKENFNLKLRIYFLEERMGSNFNADKEDAIKKNIELMVDLENVRKELEDKQELLCQAVKAMEIEEEQKRREIELKDKEIVDLKNVIEFDNRQKVKRHSQDGQRLNFFSGENLDLSKNSGGDIIRKLQDTVEDLEQQLRKERERPDRFGNSIEVSENVRSKFKAFENQIEVKNFKLDTLSYELEKASNQIAMCNLQVANLEKNLKEKDLHLQNVLVELKRKDEDLNERDSQLQKFANMLEEVHVQMERKDRKIEKYRTMLAQCENKNEEMIVYIDNLKSKIQNLEVRLEAALDEVKKNNNKSEFVLSTKQGVKSSNTDVELFSVSNSLPLSETPTKTTTSKTPLKSSKSHKSLHSISSSQFISPEKSKSLNSRSNNDCPSPLSEPLSKSSSMIEINQDGSLSHEELLELKRNHYKACKIIKTMIQKKNEYVEQIDKLEILVSEKSNEIETLKSQVAKLTTTSPKKKSIQEKVCEMNITASSNPAANKENSMDQNNMNLTGQYKELAAELETKIELLSATLHEKDNQVSRLKIDLETKSNQIIDLEFEILALNQGVGQSFNTTTTSEHETTMDKLFREKLEKDQIIEKLECELRKRTCDLQGIVNNELWEKNRSIEKLEIALKIKDHELDELKTNGQNKDLQLRILKDKINELGVHVNFPPGLTLTEVGEPPVPEDVDKLQEHLKVCLQERKQLIAQVDELKTKLRNTPERDASDLQEKYDNICEEFETSEKLRLEHQEICVILSTRLEELCHFLNHLLKQKAVLGFLGTEQARKLQSVLSKSINLSQTLSTSISLNPDQSLLQLTNITNLLDSTRNDSWNFDEFFTPDEENNSYLSIVPSDVTLTYQNHLNRISAGNNTEQLEVIKVLRNQVANLKREIELRDVELEKKLKNDAVVENADQFVNLLVDMQSKLGEACKSSNLVGDKSANTSTTLKNKNLESESESWSEPDRNVSLARIGLNDDSVRKTLSKRNRFNNSNSFSTESTEEEEGHSLNKTPSKKGSLAESRQTIISLHEQVCEMELKLKDKENQLLAAQVAFYETDNFFKQEKIKYEEKKCENAQLTQQISYLEQKMDETSKENATFERKIEKMELEHKNLLLQIEDKNKKLDDAENKKRLAEEKVMELQRVIFALEDFRKNVEATMELKDKEMNNIINRMEIEKSKAIASCESNAKMLEKAKADMLEAEEQLQTMHKREVQLKDELEANYSENLKKMEKDYEIQANRCRDAVIQIKNFYEKEYIKKSEVDRRTLEVDGITKEVDKLKCTIQESETKMHGMENREMELTSKVHDLQKEHQNKIYELQEELDNATLQFSEAILEKSKLKSENALLEQKLQQICGKETDSIVKVSSLKKELQDVQTTLQVQIAQLERQKSLLELKIKNLDAANSDLQCANAELHNRLIKFQINKSGGDQIPSMSLPNSPSNKSLHGLSYARQFSDHSGYASEDIPTSENGSRGLLPIVCVGSHTLPNIIGQVEVDCERIHANSSPDLGIESDHGRFSSLEANTNISRPLLPTLQLTESMSNLLDPVQDLSCANDGCCKKTKEIANENVELRKRLLRTRRALEETLNRLTLANKQKKEVEKSICKQIHKTSQVLRKAKANLDSGSETDLVKN